MVTRNSSAQTAASLNQIVKVAGSVVTDKIQAKSLTLSLNTCDFTLVDPTSVPALGDTVVTYNPPWSGTVTQVKTTDQMKSGHKWVAITATNTDELTASVGPSVNQTSTWDFEVTKTRKDSTDETRGEFKTLVGGILPGQTIAITSTTHGYAGDSFTVREVKVDWFTDRTPIYTVSFGDPIVTMSVWLNNDPDVFPIDSTKITDGAVTTPKLAANSVTADKLEAQLILATLFKTGSSGARLELDSSGLRSYDTSENVLVNVPTDGVNPVYVNGQLEATTLNVTGNATLRGTANVLDKASVTTLSSYQAPPTQAPSLAQSWDTTQWDDGTSTAFNFGFTYSNFGGGSVYYDSAGGASGATACYVGVVKPAGDDHYWVYEWKASDGSLDRTTEIGIGPVTSTWGMNSITRIGTNWYVSVHQSPAGGDPDGFWSIYKLNRSDGTSTGSSVFVETNGFGYGATLTTDGTNVWAIYNSTNTTTPTIGSTTLKRKIYNTSLVQQDSDSITLPSTPSGKTWVQLMGAFLYNDGGGTDLYLTLNWTVGATANTELGYTYNYSAGATPSINANEDWLAPTGIRHTTNGYSTGGLVHNGTNFYHLNYADGTGTFTRYKYENWTAGFTTNTQKFWVGYTWYDSDATGGTHESTIGPRGNITLDRRKKLYVTTAAIPDLGGTDDPNQVRVYFLPNATDPGATALKLQTTTSSVTSTYTTYNSGGAADPGANGFSTIAGAASLSTFGSEWVLKGNGLISRVGTSFPASPSANDHYYRSDLQMEFFYDGTRWLSTTLYHGTFHTTAAQPYSATASGGMRLAVPPFGGGTDLWLEDVVTQFYVVGGTALSASHKWVGVLSKAHGAPTLTTLDTINIDSGASSTWRSDSTVIDALLQNGTTENDLEYTWTKTGTPGNLHAVATITYRIVTT